MVKNEFQLPSFPELRPRIGVKFRPSAPFSPQGAHGDPTAPWQTLGARFPDLQLEPFFIGLSPEGLEYLERQARASGGAPGLLHGEQSQYHWASTPPSSCRP